MDINGRDVISGEFLEVLPYSRIVFTWGVEADDTPVPPGSSVVEVSFIPDGEGTLVRLVHRGLPTPESIRQHADGWDHYLSRLSLAAAGENPGPDPWDTATLPSSTS